MQFITLNHPVDCGICDKAGECTLQDYSFNFGSRQARTQEPRRKLQKRKDIGPRMILDQERCILCRRCVRFCREITGTHELGVFNMGDRSVLDVMEGAPLANDYSICTADICPVGALESKDFHHKLRVWFLKKTESVCPSCANGCNITVNHHRNQIWRLMPRRNDAVNECWMCDHGRLNYQYVNSPERLRTPLLRTNGQLAPCGWDEAITAGATQLRRMARASGGGSIAAVASPHLTNEESFRFAQLLRALEVTNVDVAVRLGAHDTLLIKSEKAANARGARDMGLCPGADGVGLPALLEVRGEGADPCPLRLWSGSLGNGRPPTVGECAQPPRLLDCAGPLSIAAGRARARGAALADVRGESGHVHEFRRARAAGAVRHSTARRSAQRWGDLQPAARPVGRGPLDLRPGRRTRRRSRRRCRSTRA